jgi:hypothetical protein
MLIIIISENGRWNWRQLVNRVVASLKPIIVLNDLFLSFFVTRVNCENWVVVGFHFAISRVCQGGRVNYLNSTGSKLDVEIEKKIISLHAPS